MSASPPPSATVPSSKRPLEEPSSPSGPGDQPDAKRPALDKVIKEDSVDSPETAVAEAPASELELVKPEADIKGEFNGAADGDTVVPDAPHSNAILSGEAHGHGAETVGQRQDESNWLHVRAIISSAEAATVIGKGGENVSQIRKLSAARCTVSDYARGAVERILTVSGAVDAVAKVRHIYTTFFHTSDY